MGCAFGKPSQLPGCSAQNHARGDKNWARWSVGASFDVVETKRPGGLGGQNEAQVVANAEVACLHSSQNGKERGRRTRIRRVETTTDAAIFRRWIRIVEDWDRE
jgi:hypothetical protein